MCGIAGIVSLDSPIEKMNLYIEQMTNRLRHRGPDDAGFMLLDKLDSPTTAGNNDTTEESWTSSFAYSPKSNIRDLHKPSSIAIGHRRLSVIDDSAAGHQPMCNKEGNIWLVLNGEIYNHNELRKELKKLGGNFISRSDSEVLLQAYETWGIDCLKKLNGMWSFIIYDSRVKKMYGSRDRTGVKPLYFFKDKNFFCFASEVKAFFDLPFVGKKTNEFACFNYLFNGIVEKHGETLLENISEFPPSHYFSLDLNTGDLAFHKYFNIEVNTELGHYSRKQAEIYSSELKHLLIKAVDSHLNSDIPVGFCLSGGIDSSSIVCIAQQLKKEKSIENLGDRLTVFTAVNAQDGYCETKWAQSLVNKYNLEWHPVHCTSADMVRLLPQIIQATDSPLISTSTYAHYNVLQSAQQQGIHVLLEGVGADELFTGYSSFYTSLYLDYLKSSRFIDLARELASLNNSPYRIKDFLRSCSRNLIGQSSLRPESDFFTKQAWHTYSRKAYYSDECIAKSLPENLQDYFTNHYLKNLLRLGDKSSMQFSVETRVPFADDISLMQFAFSIPSVYKIYDGWSKRVLRDSMEGIIPDEIRWRTDKLGFSTPQDNWISEINSTLKKIILDSQSNCQLVDKDKILKSWDGIFHQNNSKLKEFIFRYTNYLVWEQTVNS